jgi:hypothetical protein
VCGCRTRSGPAVAHAGIAELIDQVQSVRPSRAGSANRRLAEQLGSAADELSIRLDEHLDTLGSKPGGFE